MGPLKKERFLSGIAQMSSIKDERTLLSHHIQHAFIIPSYNFCIKTSAMSCQTTPAKYMNTKQVGCFLHHHHINVWHVKKFFWHLWWAGKARQGQCANVRIMWGFAANCHYLAWHLHWDFVIWTQLECYKYNILWLSDVTPANSENLWHWVDRIWKVWTKPLHASSVFCQRAHFDII